MKKILTLIAFFSVINCTYAQIKSYSQTDIEKMEQAQKPETKPYNAGKPAYDGTSNHIGFFSNIVGLQIYFQNPTQCYYTSIKSLESEMEIKVKALDFEKMSELSPKNLKEVLFEYEPTSVTIKGTELSNTKTISESYLTLANIVTPESEDYKRYTSQITVDKTKYLSYKTGAIFDPTTNSGKQLTLDKSGALCTFSLEKSSSKPKSGVMHKDYYKSSPTLGYKYFSIATQALDNDKPILLSSKIKGMPKIPMIYVLVEDSTKDTLLLSSLNGGVVVEYYNKMVELHKGKKFAPPTQKNVNISNKLADKATSIQVSNKDTLECKDIIVYKGNVIALMSSPTKGEFGMLTGDVNEFKASDKKNIRDVNADNVNVEHSMPVAYCALGGLQPVEFIKAEKDYYKQTIAAIKELNADLQAKREKRSQELDKEIAAKQTQRKSDLYKKYGAKFGEAIFTSKIMLGMTSEMVLEAWGKPSNKQVTTSQEIWYYTGGALNSELLGRVTFKSGKVISFLSE
ncbi:MAG: hypothetical protein R3Y38_02060 [Rikenellaceae bacterium]